MTNKEQELIDRVKLMLGGDVVKIEIPDSSIYKCMQIALDTIEPYIPDTRYLTTKFARAINLSQVGCEEVLRLMPGHTISSAYGVGEEFQFGYGLDGMSTASLCAWSANDTFTLRSLYATAVRSSVPDTNIPFDYDRTTHILYPSPGIVYENITIEFIPEVTCLDSLQDKASQKWVYLYTLALTKEVIGRIRSKAKSSAIPIELDGDTLLREAENEKATLEKALTLDALGPVGVLR